jgi:arylsulfatase A
MKKPCFSLKCLWLGLFIAMMDLVGFSDDKPTNIVLIMADDMGYEALSVNGSESCQTPNLDQLAESGLRFDNAFANPLCTPSRVKLMTGKYNVRNYTRFGELPRDQITFAHQLKTAGYTTCIAGKWQLGKEADSPQHFGFDEALLWQHTSTGRSQNGKKKIDRRFVNPILERNGKVEEYTGGEYGPQILADFVCKFIRDNKKKPFMVYYPMVLTHCPFDPTPDSKDWDPKRLGSTKYKGDLNDPQRYFKDMTAYVDKIVGQIVAQLEASGLRENTLLIFTGDNGTDQPIVTKWRGNNVAGGKGAMNDWGTRVPFIASWPSGIKNAGRVVNDLVEFTDVMPTLCDVSKANLPEGDPGDGVSLVPILNDKVGERKKEKIYIWYKGRVMVRNKDYSLVAKANGSKPMFKKHSGPFEEESLEGSTLSETEEVIKENFMATLFRLGEIRKSDPLKSKKGKKKQN